MSSLFQLDCPFSRRAGARAGAGAVALGVSMALLACGRGRSATDAGVLADAGAEAVAGLVVVRADGLGVSPAKQYYPPRMINRLAAAKAIRHDALVPMPADLVLRVEWETRDDLVYAKRYLTQVRVVVDHVEARSTCAITKHEAMPERRSTGDPLRFDVSIDYTCVEGKNTTKLSLPIGIVSAEGFQRIGVSASSGSSLTPGLDLHDGAAPAPEKVAVPSISFAPGSAALDARGNELVDEYAKVMAADPELTACVVYYSASKPRDVIVRQRYDAVRARAATHGIVPNRLMTLLSQPEPPPASDSFELWPTDAPPAKPMPGGDPLPMVVDDIDPGGGSARSRQEVLPSCSRP